MHKTHTNAKIAHENIIARKVANKTWGQSTINQYKLASIKRIKEISNLCSFNLDMVLIDL